MLRVRGVVSRCALVVTVALAGCHSRTRPQLLTALGPGGEGRSIVGFSSEVRLEKGQDASRIKLRIFVQAKGADGGNHFRIEGSGPVGGVGVIATGGREGVRIVVPSRRRHAIIPDLGRDVGSGLLGIPLRGCDLELLLGIVTRIQGFDACGSEEPHHPLVTPPPPARPESIERSDGRGGGVRIRLVWAEQEDFPATARIEPFFFSSESMVFSRFRALPPPSTPGLDFFEEPIPAGSREVRVEELATGRSSK